MVDIARRLLFRKALCVSMVVGVGAVVAASTRGVRRDYSDQVVEEVQDQQRLSEKNQNKGDGWLSSLFSKLKQDTFQKYLLLAGTVGSVLMSAGIGFMLTSVPVPIGAIA